MAVAAPHALDGGDAAGRAPPDLIGKLSQRGEFVLADRSDSEFPILIGRNLLRDVMLVDVSGNNLAPLQRTDESAKN